MAKIIEYFFSIGSPWSFIGLDAFITLADREGAEIKPFLATVVEENGGIYSRNRPEPRRLYWMRDLERWSRVRGKTLKLADRPTLSDATPASLMVIAAHLDGLSWVTLTNALQNAFWCEAADIGKPEIRQAIADAAGFDGARLLQREIDDDVTSKWAADREHALQSGVFGFPTYRFDGELYWGQDSLPFLERHLRGDKP